MFILVEISIMARKSRSRLEWTRIFFGVEQKGYRFRFAYQYEKFRPERNEINNIALDRAKVIGTRGNYV